MAEVRDLIRNLGSEGRTVLISSHLLNEVEQVCDSVAIISRGRLVVQGDVADLLHPQEQVRLRTTDDDKALAILTGRGRTSRPPGPKDEALVVTIAHERSSELTALLSKSEVYVTEIAPLQVSLEQYFLDVTGENGERPE